MASVSTADRREADSQIVARNSIVLLGRYLSIWALNALLVLFLPRYLGAQGLGQIQFAQSFVALFAVGVGLGAKQFLIKEIARDGSQLRRYLGSAVGLRLLTSAIVLAVIITITQMADHSETARQVVYLAAAWMIVRALAQLMSTLLQGLEAMGRSTFGEIVNKLLVAVVGIAVLLLGGGVVAYASVIVLGVVVELIVTSWFVSRRAPLRVDFNYERMKRIFIGGMPFLLMGFLLSVYSHIDVVMLRFMTNEEVVGWHALGLQIYHALEFLPLVLTTALLPTLSRMFKANAPGTAEVASRSISVVLLVMVPIGFGITMVAAELIDFLPYPDTFSNTVPVLMLLGAATAVSAVLIVFGTIVAAVDRQLTWAIAMMGTVALNVALNAVAIPYFQDTYDNGAIGASAVTLLSESVMVGVGIWLVPKRLYTRQLMSHAGKVALAAGAMVAVVLIGKAADFGLFALVGVGVVAYGATILGTRAVTAQDVAFLKAVAKRKVANRSPSGPTEA